MVDTDSFTKEERSLKRKTDRGASQHIEESEGPSSPLNIFGTHKHTYTQTD